MKADDPGRRYDAKFYRELIPAQASAREILPIVLEIIKPASVVDVGCGTGHWLAAARELGVRDILGLDGVWVDREQLVISAENFRIHDLATPLQLERRFDLALSLEVAEHLSPAAARNYVQNLSQAADAVLFSAAIPGQGGRRHLNEQWPAYWADWFQEFGYECYDYVRPKVWTNPRVAWYYAQNSLIFSCRGERYRLGAPVRPLPLVHPELWSAEVARRQHPGKLLERLFKSMLLPAPRRPS
jgi:SAM-dependent methyltransferase